MADLVPSSHPLPSLEVSDLGPDPIAAFGRWLAAAEAAGLDEPTAMTLATADARGRPSARMVLLKGVDAGGFTFYTNHGSRKGRELEANPHAALVFHWGPLARQVRIEGGVTRRSDADSDAYFASRALGSRMSAAASPQSEVIPDRAALERRVEAIAREFGDALPRPAHWGGYRVRPERIEFWQGRSNRLHDRLRYTRTSEGWTIERLAP